MEKFLAILSFLIPGIFCYWYNQWRERKREEELWEQRKKNEWLCQKWKEAKQNSDGKHADKDGIWFVDPEGNVKKYMDEDGRERGEKPSL